MSLSEIAVRIKNTVSSFVRPSSVSDSDNESLRAIQDTLNNQLHGQFELEQYQKFIEFLVVLIEEILEDELDPQFQYDALSEISTTINLLKQDDSDLAPKLVEAAESVYEFIAKKSSKRGIARLLARPANFFKSFFPAHAFRSVAIIISDSERSIKNLAKSGKIQADELIKCFENEKQVLVDLLPDLFLDESLDLESEVALHRFCTRRIELLNSNIDVLSGGAELPVDSYLDNYFYYINYLYEFNNVHTFKLPSGFLKAIPQPQVCLVSKIIESDNDLTAAEYIWLIFAAKAYEDMCIMNEANGADIGQMTREAYQAYMSASETVRRKSEFPPALISSSPRDQALVNLANARNELDEYSRKVNNSSGSSVAERHSYRKRVNAYLEALNSDDLNPIFAKMVEKHASPFVNRSVLERPRRREYGH